MERKVSLNEIAVFTHYYENNHEKKPRGTGVWAFSIGSKHSEKEFWVNEVMLYSKALDLAKKEAQRLGKRIIYVLP